MFQLENKKRRCGIITSVSIFLYFITILYLFIGENDSIRYLPYRIISIVCTIEYFLPQILQKTIKLNRMVVTFVFFGIITGFLNLWLVQNSTLLSVIECTIFSTSVACLLIEKGIDRRWIEWAIYVYAFVFVVRIIRFGLFVRITRFSNNQVTVAMLIPVVIYYVISDIYHEKPNIIPALVTWILALLSRGRTGIIVCTFLFFAVFLDYTKYTDQVGVQSKFKSITKLLSKAILIFGGTYLLYILYSKYGDLILSKFFERGVDNTAREIMWKEYIKYACNDIKFFLLGVPKRILLIGQLYDNNTHNSFISIHANNGIMMFLFCVGLLIRAVNYSIKKHYYIYLACILTFCVRGFFDNVFWGTWGTITFIFLLFIPLLKKET